MISSRASRLEANWQQMDYFIAAMAGLAGAFILSNLLRRFGHWLNSKRKTPLQPRALLTLSRTSRSLLLRKAPLFPSFGHAILIISYLVINIILLLTDIDFKSSSRTSNYAARAGWLAVGNLVLLVFLALRNTPLAWLASQGHERLNILHRVAGLTTIAMVVIHAAGDSADYVRRGKTSQLASRDEVCGEIGAVALLLMGVTGILARRKWYELFYAAHVALWIVAVTAIALHQPYFDRRMLVAVLVAAGMWLLDRIVRTARLLVCSANNHVTLYPLPRGATRVILNKGPPSWAGVAAAARGRHCFLYVPKIRALETHPFTLVAADPFEFVVSSRDGFTQALHEYALANPGTRLSASVEGPYGEVPDPRGFDTVFLIAGGSGASFTFGTALNMLRASDPGESEKKHIIFIWIVRHESQLSWFASHLQTLRQDDRISLHLYITRRPAPSKLRVQTGAISHPSSPTDSPSSPSTSPSSSSSSSSFRHPHQQSWPSPSTDPEKSAPLSLDAATSNTSQGTHPAHQTAHPLSQHIHRHRPDIISLVRTAITGTQPNKRILIMSCGPHSLTTQVRNAAASCILPDGPSVDLHCQQFGW